MSTQIRITSDTPRTPKMARAYQCTLFAKVGPRRWVGLTGSPLILPVDRGFASVLALVKRGSERLLFALSGDPGAHVTYHIALSEPRLCPSQSVSAALPTGTTKAADTLIIIEQIEAMINQIETGAFATSRPPLPKEVTR